MLLKKGKLIMKKRKKLLMILFSVWCISCLNGCGQDNTVETDVSGGQAVEAVEDGQEQPTEALEEADDENVQVTEAVATPTEIIVSPTPTEIVASPYTDGGTGIFQSGSY
jgi:hypothetical protein